MEHLSDTNRKFGDKYGVGVSDTVSHWWLKQNTIWHKILYNFSKFQKKISKTWNDTLRRAFSKLNDDFDGH